jgi:hypothetical protein
MGDGSLIIRKKPTLFKAVKIRAFNPADVPFTIQLVAGDEAQTADCFQILAQDGTTVLFKIDKSGNITGGTLAPGNVVITGTESVSGLASLNGGLTVPTAKTAIITDADALTVGGLIVPQHFYLHYNQTPGVLPITDVVFTLHNTCKLVAMIARWRVAGTDGGAVTLSAAKDPSGTAPGGGTGLLASTISLKGTINTNNVASLSATPADLTFAAGDSLSQVVGGTLTAVAGLAVTYKFQRV